MKPALKFGLLFSAVWIVIKLAFFGLNIFQEDILVPAALNNLCLLLGISFGMYFSKKKEGFGNGTALSDIKNGMIAGAPYVLIVSVFMYFYYDKINPGFAEKKYEARMEVHYSNLQRDSYIDSLIIQNPDFETKSKGEIYAEIKKSEKQAYNAKFTAVLSLLGLMVLAFTYAIFITVIFRKILLKDFIQE